MKSTEQHKYTNQLIRESSPYLLQHAHNPVNWYPWGQEALDKAKRENKLIIVSIGYAACHWCHVMEHESFENEEVANYMNEHFVAIKVDREERPDIDQIYINAVQLLSGRGGWPLNCIGLPDGRPIYGGTYFPKDHWVDMLAQVSQFVTGHPDKAEEQARHLTEGVQNNEMIYAGTVVQDFSLDDLDEIFLRWKGNIDYSEGGSAGAPKFPLPVGIQFLLQYHYLTHNEDALRAVMLTLDKMSAGGIYDQVGGGFSRYSTDAYWKVPHFEKMLYDNAQLVSLYAAAYQQSGNAAYKTIVSETLDFVLRELTSDEGGFYASLDADSEGEEGKFYTWTKHELQKALGLNAAFIVDYYNVTESGNWENGQNILFKKQTDAVMADKYKLTEAELSGFISGAKATLLHERSSRVRPGLDDNILCGWNGLMLKACVDAYRVFGDQQYLDMALRNAAFINSKIKQSDGRLNRNYKNGKATINAFLDDYAFTIQAFISLYQATFDYKWLEEAHELTTYAIVHFYDAKSAMFYYTSDLDASLIARKMELSDNVIPSSNSEMAKNLYQLGHYFYNDEYLEMARKMLGNVKEHALESAAYYANWDILMGWLAREPYEIAIVGENCEALRKEFDSYYLPDVFLSGGKTEGKAAFLSGKLVEGQTTIYVCRNKQCQRPVTDLKEALSQMSF